MNTIFLSGYAQVPKGTNLSNSVTFGVMFEIEKQTNKIVDVDSTFVTELAKDYLRRLIVGYNFETQFDEIIQIIDDHFYIPSISSVEMAFKVAHQRFLDNLKK